jgi:hypothetical protein
MKVRVLCQGTPPPNRTVEYPEISSNKTADGKVYEVETVFQAKPMAGGVPQFHGNAGKQFYSLYCG